MATTMIPVWEITDRLTKSRHVAGVSVQEMADRLGVSRTTISNYESGRTHPKRSVLIAWSLATGVSLDWLETGTNPQHDGPAGGQTLQNAPSGWKVPRVTTQPPLVLVPTAVPTAA